MLNSQSKLREYTMTSHLLLKAVSICEQNTALHIVCRVASLGFQSDITEGHGKTSHLLLHTSDDIIRGHRDLNMVMSLTVYATLHTGTGNVE
jgi:hypothetical protein